MIFERSSKGLDASKTNNLLRGMLEYLQEIRVNTTGNQVTQAAYANVFGITATDLRAVNNLANSKQTIETLYNTTLNYGQAMEETNLQLKEIQNRVHLSEALSTLVENATTSAALKIGGNAITYGTWQILNIIEGLTGGIAIPAISVMGNMVDLHATVTGLAKAGIAGVSLLESLMSSLGNLGSGGLPSLDKWGGTETISRGTQFNLNYKGVQSGLTKSRGVATVNSDGDTYVDNSLNEAASDAESKKEITNAAVEEDTPDTKGFYDSTTAYLAQIAKALADMNVTPPKVEIASISPNAKQVFELAVHEGFVGDLNTNNPDGNSAISYIFDQLSEILPDILHQSLVSGVEYKVEVVNNDMINNFMVQ